MNEITCVNDSTAAALEPIDPTFVVAPEGHMALLKLERFEGERARRLMRCYLAHRVTRFPKDLNAHVNRLQLHRLEGDGEAFVGALIDLFIALGGAGEPLKQRLFQGGRQLIPAPWLRFLEPYLTSPLAPEVPLPMLAPTLLATQLGAGPQLVETISARPLQRSVLDEARDLIDGGLLEEAQTLLEQSVIASPTELALQQELIDLYRALRAASALRAMAKRLRAVIPAGDPAAKASTVLWETAAAELAQQQAAAKPSMIQRLTTGGRLKRRVERS